MEKIIKIPHNFEPRFYQLAVLKSPKQFKVIVFHRRSGKTKMAWNELIRQAMHRKGIYHYVAPTYGMAKRIIWQDSSMMEHLPREIVEKKNDTELYARLKNGSIIFLVGADNPQRLRGTNPIGVIFDEYAEMKENIWNEIYRPILFQNKGWAWFISTPRGTNHFWRLYQQAKELSDWDVFFLSACDNPFVDQEGLKKEKETMPQSFFEQEYLCKFLEGASQFFRKIEENIYQEKEEIKRNHFYQIGIDLGKYADWTVLCACDRHTFKVGFIERFNQLDWNFQQKKICTYCKQFENYLAYLDTTGLGDPVFDNLQEEGINLYPYRFTEQSREALLKNLAILLEQGKIKIPDYEELISELKAFQYSLKDRGKIRIEVPEGMHDDCVMSLALACWGLGQPLPCPKEDEIIENIWIPNLQEY